MQFSLPPFNPPRFSARNIVVPPSFQKAKEISDDFIPVKSPLHQNYFTAPAYSDPVQSSNPVETPAPSQPSQDEKRRFNDALKQSNIKVIEEFLAQYPTQLNVRKYGLYSVDTPLVSAIRYKQWPLVQHLINVHGANVNIGAPLVKVADSPGETSVEVGKVLETLLKAGASPETKDHRGFTVLHMIAGRGHTHLIPLFSKDKSLLNITDDDGRTALFHSVAYSNLDTLKALVAAGADVNLPNKLGNTPLMQAAEEGNVELLECLLNSGASLTQRDQFEQTAIDWARQAGKLENVKFLEKQMGKPSIPFKMGMPFSLWERKETPTLSKQENYAEGAEAWAPLFQTPPGRYPIIEGTIHPKLITAFKSIINHLLPENVDYIAFQNTQPIQKYLGFEHVHTHIVQLSRFEKETTPYLRMCFQDKETNVSNGIYIDQEILLNLETGHYVRRGPLRQKETIYTFPDREDRSDFNPINLVLDNMYQSLTLLRPNVPNGGVTQRYGPVVKVLYKPTEGPIGKPKKEFIELRWGLPMPYLNVLKNMYEAHGIWKEEHQQWWDAMLQYKQEVETLPAA